MSPKPVDSIVSAKWIIPVVPSVEYENHSLIIHEGKILDIVPTENVDDLYTATSERVELKDHAILPGLINMHTHSAMTLTRSIVDGVDLSTWLNNYIWPVERKFVSEDFCLTGVQKACIEMIRSGTTCFNDMYFYPEITASVADSCGLRAAVGVPILNFGTNWAETPEIAIEKFEALWKTYKEHDRIQITIAPHAPYTVSDELFVTCKQLSEEKDVLIHTHLHETAQETPEGARAFSRLEKLGLITNRLLAVHMTQLIPEEIKSMEDNNIGAVVHCPESNLKLGSGLCPVSSLGTVNVCIGTDGASSNDDLDLFGEIRTANLLDNYRSTVQLGGLDKAIKTKQWIEIATINAAKALRIDKHVGSLEVGKQADLIAVKVNALPVYDIQYTLVMSNNSVTDVWVAGKPLMREQKILVLDEDDVNKRTELWGNQIKATLEEVLHQKI